MVFAQFFRDHDKFAQDKIIGSTPEQSAEDEQYDNRFASEIERLTIEGANEQAVRLQAIAALAGQRVALEHLSIETLAQSVVDLNK